MPPSRPPRFLGRSSERRRLDRLLSDVRIGQSAALVVRGEPGIGKTALLGSAAGRAAGSRVARLAGVQAEVEPPFAAVHQLCAPMLPRLDAPPKPQRHALAVALSMTAGDPPDRFLVG